MICKLPKKFIQIKKKETLPTFLLNLSPLPVEISLSSKSKKTDVYSGPLFFDACDIIHHPQHHFAEFDTHRLDYPVIHPSEQFSNLFLSLPDDHSQEPPKPPLNILKRKNLKPIIDPYLHRCPGTRKIFKFEAVPRVITFGKTKSTLETEICEEIPFCRYNYFAFRVPKKSEIMASVDTKNKNRTLLTPEQRAAHLHFPKRFRTVELIGPRIPASFTITKIPSKRKRLFEWDFAISNATIKKPSTQLENEQRKSVSFAKSSSQSKEVKGSFSTKIIDYKKQDKRNSGIAADKFEKKKENADEIQKNMDKNLELKRNLKNEEKPRKKERQNTITFKDVPVESEQPNVTDAVEDNKPNFIEMKMKKI